MERFDSCRCPHAPFSTRVFAEASALFDRRAFLIGAAAGLAAVFLPRPSLADGEATPEDITLLRAARMFDGLRMHQPGVCVVKGERIVSLMAGDAGSAARVVDLGDVTLMPGLIDAHTHCAARVVGSTYLEYVGMPGESADSIAEAALLSLKNVNAMFANGFTTLRDVGGSAGIDLALRDAIRRGAIPGPRILAAGTSLSITGGHGDANDRPDWVHVDDDYQPATAYGPYGFREQVRVHVKRGVDLIKILATGGVLSYGDTWDIPQFNLDEVQAVVDEATKFGRKVSAHAHGDKGISVAVEGGVHSVEHATGVSEKTLKAMVDRGTALVPTIWALDSILQSGNPNRIAAGSLDKAHQAATIRNEGMARATASGVWFVYGTDAGVFPHAENNKDFALLQSMGLRPLELLKSATSSAAELLGTKDRGKLEPGLLADIVAFPGDASADIAPLGGKPAFVMLGGKRVN